MTTSAAKKVPVELWSAIVSHCDANGRKQLSGVNKTLNTLCRASPTAKRQAIQELQRAPLSLPAEQSEQVVSRLYNETRDAQHQICGDALVCAIQGARRQLQRGPAWPPAAPFATFEVTTTQEFLVTRGGREIDSRRTENVSTDVYPARFPESVFLSFWLVAQRSWPSSPREKVSLSRSTIFTATLPPVRERGLSLAAICAVSIGLLYAGATLPATLLVCGILGMWFDALTPEVYRLSQSTQEVLAANGLTEVKAKLLLKLSEAPGVKVARFRQNSGPLPISRPRI